MKVYHVVPDLSLGAGGPSRSVTDLVEAMADLGVDITLLCGRRRGSSEVRLSRNLKRAVFMRGLAGIVAGFAIAFFILRSSSPNVIIIHSVWNPVTTLAAAAARWKGILYIVVPHGMLADRCLAKGLWKKRLYYLLIDWATLKGASLLRFLNETERTNSSSNWLKLGRSIIVPNGVKIPQIPTAFPTAFTPLLDRELIVFLGRINPIKGLRLQLSAVKQLIPKFPKLLWVLVGPDDGGWSELRQEIAEHNLENHVRWLGPIYDDTRFAIIANARVILQTSFHEAHSMTVNEALGIGTPVVVTTTVNYPEVGAINAGCVVNPDPAEIAAAVECVLKDSRLSDLMRENGRQFASEFLDWRAIAKQFVGHLSSLLETHEH